MNIFNRIIMIIIMLFFIVSSIVAGVNIFTGLFEWQDVSDRFVSAINSMNPYVMALILFAILAVSLIILIFEFYRRKIKVANISADQSGKSMLELKTVSRQIREKLLEIEDVVNPRVSIIPGQNGIIINSFSKISEGIDVAGKTKEIREMTADFAFKNLGLKVLKSNYTATGFVPKKEKKAGVIKEEEPEAVIEPETEKESEPYEKENESF
jgi:hypothetical protein